MTRTFVKNFIKDPAAKAVYRMDWTDWLDLRETTIAESTWTVETGSGLSQISNVVVSGNLQTQIVLGGGNESDSAVYAVTNHIITASGLEEERTIGISVHQR